MTGAPPPPPPPPPGSADTSVDRDGGEATTGRSEHSVGTRRERTGGPPGGAAARANGTGTHGLVRGLSLRTRVGALAALSVGLAVTLTALAAYLTVSTQLTRSVDENLLDRARDVVNSSLGTQPELDTVPPDALPALGIRLAIVRSGDQGTTFGFLGGEDNAPPLGEPELAVAQGAESQSVRTASLGGESYRVVAVPAGPGYALVLAQSNEQTEQILGRVQLVSMIVGGLGIVVATWAGVSVARAGLRPVRRLTDAAEHVARTQRLDPIEVEGDDELARLAHAFNAMLAALDEARSRQARLVADAGHELRTPLTSMRTNLDLLAQSDREGGLDPADRAQIISDVRAQAEELSQLMGDLVELSREDPPQASRERVDLADVVGDALARVQRRAPRVAFSTDLEAWMVDGEPRLLDRAVTNLLDNAARYSPENGTVTVTLRGGTLEVCDEGPGIAEEDLPHIFERFYRSSEARARPGSGLGLAIVRAAALRHGGDAEAGRTHSGGARLTMRIPAASSAPLG